MFDLIGATWAFLGGLFLELLAVLWVHYAERNAYVPLSIVAALQAVAMVVGLGEAVNQDEVSPQI